MVRYIEKGWEDIFKMWSLKKGADFEKSCLCVFCDGKYQSVPLSLLRPMNREETSDSLNAPTLLLTFHSSWEEEQHGCWEELLQRQ